MALGQNTFWIIVNIPEGVAVTPKDDKRAALRFASALAAQEFMERMDDFDPNFYVVVEVPTW